MTATADSRIEAQGDGLYRVHGALTFATALGMLGSVEQLLVEPAGAERLVFDLQAVEAADSAGLALLLEWRERAGTAGRSLEYRNLPQELVNLAHISNIEGLLSEEGG